ncbi:MAG: translation elongation factor 4, partial [Proteobacteria bacterium]|nr:translation elongation factor 4 [Pseudomonadota bacterium]
MLKNIRNFCIIAHIDHGKSTLADRMLEITGTINKRDFKHGQVLDMMDLEQERGITIKLQPVRMEYKYKDENYILNLIDTPGHVDFTYEVSRSLAACEGAILLVDATQGIEAQTLANCYAAIDQNLEIIAVINKIDLPAANPEKVAGEIENTLGIKKEEILTISAKEGTNVDELLQKIIQIVPPPKEIDNSGETKALIFDSIYDSYKGVVTYIRLFSGNIKTNDKLFFINTRKEIEVLEVGYFKPKYVKTSELENGEVGYVVTGLKTLHEARVGDTLWKKGDTPKKIEDVKPLPGYKIIKPFVFSSIFCVDNQDFPLLRNAIEKLQLNDASFTAEHDQSQALGHGFRCGFLGLLHMEIIQERLEREYDLNLIVTAPSVSYKILK